MSATLVTAFFDINREKNGDGRSIIEYTGWIEKTLELACNLYVVTESRFAHMFKRPNIVCKVIKFEDSYYYKYYDEMKSIIESAEYKSRIMHPDRVECKIPEYNILQYSKFHYIEMAIKDNPFNTDYFFWVDAGISRFFLDVDITKPYPARLPSTDKFIIQKRDDLEVFKIDSNFIWKSDNLMFGTMFGGMAPVIRKIAELIDVEMKNMLHRKTLNNEQLGLALVWSKHPKLFYTINNPWKCHLGLFKLLS